MSGAKVGRGGSNRQRKKREGRAAWFRDDVACEPPKHAHPPVPMRPAGFGIFRKALMPDNEPRSLGARFQPVGERRDLPLQPIGLPRLHQLMWWIDLQKLAFHRERLAIGAAPFGAPAAANP